MPDPASQAVVRLEAAGSSSADRGSIFASLLSDHELHRHLAGLPHADREAALASIGAALRRSGTLQRLRDAVVLAMRERVAAGAGPGARIFGLPMPSGYTLDDSSGALLHQVVTGDGREQDIIVARRPIAVTGLVEDPAEGRVHVEVTWETTTGTEERAVVPRGCIADGRALVSALAEVGRDGAPVHSRSAGAMVEYLAAQEQRAGEDLPRSTLARGLGWVEGADGEALGFLAGHLLLQRGQERDTRTGWAPGHVVLAQVGGLDAVAQRVRRGGTWDIWEAVVEPALAWPVAALCLCASLAPVLLRVIPEAESAGILDISGPQGTGKTRVVELTAVSVWGVGDMRRGPVTSADNTEAGLRDYRSQVGSLPLLLNETQHLHKRPELAASLPFQLFEAQAKVLSDGAGGTRSTRPQRSGAILTGNRSLVELTDNLEGVRTRVLTVNEPPWGPRAEATRAMLLDVRGGVLQSYGHLGPRFAAAVERNRDWWPALRRSWADKARDWSITLGPGSERAADVLALYELAGAIAQRECGLGYLDVKMALEAGRRAAEGSIADLDLGTRALRAVHSWASSQELRFSGRTSEPPLRGWLGQWGREPGAALCIMQTELCDWMRHRHLDVEAVLRSWHEHGWLKTDKDRRTLRVSVGGTQSAHYAITAEGMAAAGVGPLATPQVPPPTVQPWGR